MYSWSEVKRILAQADEGNESMTSHISELDDYPLNNLHPTRRVFAHRIFQWGRDLVACHRESSHDGERRHLLHLRTLLSGSASCGECTILKTIVQHLRLLLTLRLRHLLKHAVQSHNLVCAVKGAILFKRVHPWKDCWWTQSCFLLKNFSNEVQSEFAENYHYWREHGLDRAHFNEEHKEYFHTKAVWLCACKDVGTRNGRKLAVLAQESARIVQRIQTMPRVKSDQERSSHAFSGLRSVIKLERKCMVIITCNVAYHHGFVNGTRGILVGFVYPERAPLASLPLVIVCGPVFYHGQPTWVPISPTTEWHWNQSRTQFPIVAGFAMTVNKCQGLTIKEGVVINLQ